MPVPRTMGAFGVGTRHRGGSLGGEALASALQSISSRRCCGKRGRGDALPEIDKGNSSVGEACDGPAACVAAAGGRELFTVGPEPSLPSAQPLTERLRRASACLAA